MKRLIISISILSVTFFALCPTATWAATTDIESANMGPAPTQVQSPPLMETLETTKIMQDLQSGGQRPSAPRPGVKPRPKPGIRPTLPQQTKPQLPQINIPPSDVKGRICNTTVALQKARISDDIFSIYTGDSWSFNPSLVFFFVVKKGVVPNNQSFSVEPDAGMSSKTIHIRYRWKDPTSGLIKSGVMMQGYQLQLKFGQDANGIIPGEISLEHTEKGINLKGPFNALIEGFQTSEHGPTKTISDPNAAKIRARIKQSPGLEKALRDVDKQGDKEVREWLRNPAETSPSLAKAVHEVATAELNLIRTLAVEENAQKTTAAIDSLLISKQKQFNEVSETMQEERRRARLEELEARRSRTRRTPRTRGRTGEYGVRQRFPRGRRTDPNTLNTRPQQSLGSANVYAQVAGPGDEKTRQWLQRGIENRLNLAKAVQDQSKTELNSVRKLAVEESARKTTAAIDGVLLDRQQRHEKVLDRIQDAIKKEQLLEQKRQRFMGQRTNTLGRQGTDRFRRPQDQGTRRPGGYIQRP